MIGRRRGGTGGVGNLPGPHGDRAPPLHSVALRAVSVSLKNCYFNPSRLLPTLIGAGALTSLSYFPTSRKPYHNQPQHGKANPNQQSVQAKIPRSGISHTQKYFSRHLCFTILRSQP